MSITPLTSINATSRLVVFATVRLLNLLVKVLIKKHLLSSVGNVHFRIFADLIGALTSYKIFSGVT